MRTPRRLIALTMLVFFVLACSDSGSDVDTGSSSTVSSTPDASETSASDGEVVLDQPAVWPAPDVVLTTPEEAAADFVESVLGVPAELGGFAAGDSRSGEIEVFAPREGGDGDPLVRGVLFVRQIGPTDGWYVIGGGSDGVMIDGPASSATVVGGSVVVEGRARGFEANVVVSAFRAGFEDPVLDQVVTFGGSAGTLEPYSVTVDLSDSAAGDVVGILVRGGTGLETDPGEFAVIPVVVG